MSNYFWHSMEELRLYFHPHSETVINMSRPACAEETLTAGHRPQIRQTSDPYKHTQSECGLLLEDKYQSVSTK